MSWLGVSAGVTELWASYLTGIRRRFRINGLLGKEIKLTTGFSEDCGLSVVAMVVTGWAMANFAEVDVERRCVERASTCTLDSKRLCLRITSNRVVGRHGP